MRKKTNRQQVAFGVWSAKIASNFPYALCVISAIAVAFLMLMTVVDVTGRYIFNQPLVGAFEMTELVMAFIIFAALPAVSEKRKHITVDLLANILPSRLKRMQAIFTDLICGGICFITAWRIWIYGQRLIERKEVTLEFHITIGTFACALAVMMIFTGIVFMTSVWLIFIGHKTIDRKGQE